MIAKQDFTALISGQHISLAAGEMVDPKLDKRIVAKLKTQGLIVNNKKKKEAAND